MFDATNTQQDNFDTDTNDIEIDAHDISRALAQNILIDKGSYKFKEFLATAIAANKAMMQSDSLTSLMANTFEAADSNSLKPIIKDIGENFSQIELMRNDVLNHYGFDVMTLKNAIDLPSHYIEESTNKNGDVKKYLSANFFIDAIEKIEVDVKYLGLRLDTGGGKSTARDNALRWLNKHDTPFYRNFNLQIINGRSTHTKSFDTPFFTKELRCQNQYNKDGDNHNIKPVGVKARGNRAVLTINHLPKVWELVGNSWRNHECFNVVVLDEFITILGQMFGDACTEYPYIVPALRDTFKHADLVIMMDANLSDSAIDLFRKHLALDASDSNLFTYSFNLGRWKNVNAIWLDTDFAFKATWQKLHQDNIIAKLEGQETGLVFHSNIRGQLNNHIEFLIEQLSGKAMGAEMLISFKLMQTLKHYKVVYRVAVATKTPASGKKKATTHCTVYHFDFSKVSAKGIIEPQIFGEGHRLGIKFTDLVANTALLNDKNIDEFAFSPVVQAGTSFDVHKRFKNVLMLFDPSMQSSGGDGAWQSLGRFRDPLNLYTYVNDKPAYIPSELSKDDVELEYLLKTNDDFKQESLDRLEQRKKVAVKYNIDTPIAEKQELVDILNDWQVYEQLDKVMFAARLQDLIKSNTGRFKVVSYIKDAPMFGVQNINAFLKKLIQHQLYTNEQSTEIEQSRQDNFGTCKLEWYNTYSFQHTLYVKEISLDQSIDTGKSIVYMGVDDDSNIQLSDCPYCELSQEDKYTALQFAEKRKKERETIERANAYNQFTNPDNIESNLHKLSLMKSVYMDAETGQLTYRQKLSDKNIDNEIRKQANEAKVLSALIKETGVETIDDLYNLDSTQLPALNEKTARKFLGKEGKNAARPMAQVNSALRRLAFDVVDKQERERNEKRGKREYQIVTTPQSEILAIRKIDISQFELNKLNKASEKFEKMFEVLFNKE